MLTQLSDRKINLGSSGAAADPTDPAADPATQGGGGRGGANQTGKREVTWRTDGAGLSYLEQEPAPAGAAGATSGGGRGRAGGGQGAPGANAPQRKDRLYQWLPPFNDASAKVMRFSFRAVSPLFDTGPFTVCGKPEDKTVALWAKDAGGNLAMTAEASIG